MKRSITCSLLLSAGLLLAPFAQAAVVDSLPNAREVDGFYLLGRNADWAPVGIDKFIVWPTRSTPYLVTIAMPFDDLRFENAIAFRSRFMRITRFDWVYVRGMRYRIESIHRLDRDTARELMARN